MSNELKGWIKDAGNVMSSVEFSEHEEGMMSARLNNEIWDYSPEPNDFVDYCDDAIFTECNIVDGKIVYGGVVKLSEWLEANNIKGAYY